MTEKFSFTCTGHENILSLHDKTLEFTKDTYLTKKGDCILGINADFDYNKLMDFINNFSEGHEMTCFIKCDNLEDEFKFYLNKDFCSENEIVFRRSEFKSDRTLGTRCTKCACDIDRSIVEKLIKDGLNCKLKILIC